MTHPRDEKHGDRAFEHGSSGSTADSAVEGKAKLEDRFVDTPYARRVQPLPEGEKPDQLAHKKGRAESRQEALVDEAVEESFPSSDPPTPKHIT